MNISIRSLTLLAVTSAWLAACATYNNATQRIAQHITPYRITIMQGNFVSREAAAKLQLGMSRDQVSTVLGTPLLTDMFHANRWDYIFYFKRGASQLVQQRHFTVYFDQDRVVQLVGGDNLLSEYELINAIDGDKSANTRSKQKVTAVSDTATSEPKADH